MHFFARHKCYESQLKILKMALRILKVMVLGTHVCKVARLVTRTRLRDHITHVLLALHWLPVRHRIECKVLVIVFKCLHGLASIYLAELLHVHHRDSRLRQEQHLTLSVEVSKRAIGRHAFGISAPPPRNRLPVAVCAVKDLHTLKRTLKTHMFKLFYDQRH